MKLKDLDKKRLILIDLDGTTLTNEKDFIHPKTKEQLLKANKEGHYVSIITGRPWRAVEKIYNELGLKTLITNYDGAHILDPQRREFKRMLFVINPYIIKKIINNPIIKESIENVMCEYYNKVFLWKEDADLRNFFHLDSIDKHEDLIIGDINDSLDTSTNNIVLKLKSIEHKDRVVRELGKFSDAIKIQSDILYGVKATMEKPVITLTNKMASKGLAAQIVAQYYNVDIRDTIAFGDQLNDLDMIQKVGYGIAMKNGNDFLKFVSKGITHITNDEGGVGDYLEKLLSGVDV